MADLPARVISADNRLEKATERSVEELAELRWHWTLDESNAKRVGIVEYARAVARAHSTIHAYAYGYVEWSSTRRGTSTVSDCIARASVGAEKAAAIDALARATGRSFETTRRASANDVRTVRVLAEERAERRGTTAGEEIDRAARELVQSRAGEQRREATRRSQRTLEYLSMEGDIAGALRKLSHALETAVAVEFGKAERELLEHSIGQLRALLALIDSAVGGESGVDWDAELARLGAGS